VVHHPFDPGIFRTCSPRRAAALAPEMERLAKGDAEFISETTPLQASPCPTSHGQFRTCRRCVSTRSPPSA
jgi:hypothetical protein